MATPKKLASGLWFIQIKIAGERESKTFATKTDAQQWALRRAGELKEKSKNPASVHTLGEAVDAYLAKVSIKKRSFESEKKRLLAFKRDFSPLCSKLLADVSAFDIAQWRDTRLQAVSSTSANREATTLKHIWKVAANEWGWTNEASPWAKVKMPKDNPPRHRLATWQEVKRLMRNMGFVTNRAPIGQLEQTAWAYLVSNHTALRAGEVLGLTRSAVDLKSRVITLTTHKTMEKAGTRFIPFTKKAARVLAVLDESAKLAERDEYFTVTSASLDALFRKCRDRLLIDDLHFHDARAAALTRLARRMDVMRLARISGHSDLKILMNTYYRESAADIAKGI